MSRKILDENFRWQKSVSRKARITLACLSLAGLCTLAVAPVPASASTYDFVGRWMNFDRDSSGITGMVITPNRNGLDIQVFGLCRGQAVCDWDVAQATLYTSGGRTWGGFTWDFGNWTRDTSVVTANFDAGYARKFIVIRREGRDDLRIEVFTTSRDRYGRPGYVTQGRLHRWGRLAQFRDGYPGDRPDRGYPQNGADDQYPDDD